MSKRSHKNQTDLVSETQQNARWFLGRRSNTSWTEKTPAEWSRYLRNFQAQKRINLIFFILLGILLTISSDAKINAEGLTFSSVVSGFATILVWTWVVLVLKRSMWGK